MPPTKSSPTSIDPPGSSLAVRRIPARRILSWLLAGWRDLRGNPVPGIAYGLLFALGGDLILLASLGNPRLFTFAISGFFLIAPLLATGLYELSRQYAAGNRPTFIESLQAFRDSHRSIVLFGLLLALITFSWERVSAFSFARFGDTTGINIRQFATRTVASGDHTGFIMTWLTLGALLALFAYAISVVSLPLLLDRRTSIQTAIRTSLSVFSANTATLLAWAASIVALTLLGFATLLFGLIIIMPILGHASWHAYRDLVESTASDSPRPVSQ